MVSQLDNCGGYDVYKVEHPACAAVGCTVLGNFLWVSALLSFGATVGWTAIFYVRQLRARQEHQWRRYRTGFRILFLFLCALVLTCVVLGAAGGVSSVLAMVMLVPLVPICAWVLAGGIAFLPSKGKEAPVSLCPCVIMWNFCRTNYCIYI